jgi:hypothetical protein
MDFTSVWYRPATRRWLAPLLWMSWALALPGQVRPGPPPMDELLRKAGLRVAIDTARVRKSQEFRLHWRSARGSAGTFTGEELRLVERIDRNEPPPRQRSPEISSDHLVIAVLDSQGTVRHWQIIVDPRLVRGEFPDAEGRLHNTTVYRAEADFSISVPDTVDAAEVRILTPAAASEAEGGMKLSSTAALRLSGPARQ